MDEIWDRELIEKLNFLTRELKFDWKAISISLEAFQISRSNFDNVGRLKITPTICRNTFAFQKKNQPELVYPLQKSAQTTSSEDNYYFAEARSGQGHVDQKISTSEFISNSSSWKQQGGNDTNLPPPPTLPNKQTENVIEVFTMPHAEDTNISLEELIRQVESREIENKRRKEQVFQRVLNALNVSEITQADTNSYVHDEATLAFQESIKNRELIAIQQERLKAERLENKYYEDERMKLKARFDDDEAITMVETKSNNVHDHDTDDDGIVQSTQLLHMYDDDEFDKLLNEFEAEMLQLAPGKTSDEMESSSELAEILQILESTSVKPVQKEAKTNSIKLQTVLNKPEYIMDNPPQPIPNELHLSQSFQSDSIEPKDTSSHIQTNSTSIKIETEGVLGSVLETKNDPYKRFKNKSKEEQKGSSGKTTSKTEGSEDEESDDDNWKNSRSTQKMASRQVEHTAADQSVQFLQNKLMATLVSYQMETSQRPSDDKLSQPLENTDEKENESEESSVPSYEENSTESVDIRGASSIPHPPQFSESVVEEDFAFQNEMSDRPSEEIIKTINEVASVDEKLIQSSEEEGGKIVIATSNLQSEDHSDEKVDLLVHPVTASASQTRHAVTKSSGSLLTRTGDPSSRKKKMINNFVAKKSVHEEPDIPVMVAHKPDATTVEMVLQTNLPDEVDTENTVIADDNEEQTSTYVDFNQSLDPEQVIINDNITKFTYPTVDTISTMPLKNLPAEFFPLNKSEDFPPKSQQSANLIIIVVDTLKICQLMKSSHNDQIKTMDESDLESDQIIGLIIQLIWKLCSTKFKTIGLQLAKQSDVVEGTNHNPRILTFILEARSWIDVGFKVNISKEVVLIKEAVAGVNRSDFFLNAHLMTNYRTEENTLNLLEAVAIFADEGIVQHHLKKFITTHVDNQIAPSDASNLSPNDLIYSDFRFYQSIHTSFAKSLTACLVKNYVVEEHRGDILLAILLSCEEKGLRLSGMRYAYLPCLDTTAYDELRKHAPQVFQSKTFSSSHGSIHPQAILCLAFHSCSMMELTGSQLDNKFSSYNSASTNTADILREVLGPEDVKLARRTDPNCLRSLFGNEDINRNIAYPIPFSSEKLQNEISFWFGGRLNTTNDDQRIENKNSISLLQASTLRTVLLGAKIESPSNTIDSVYMTSKNWSEVQMTLLSCVKNLVSLNLFMCSLTCVHGKVFSHWFPDHPSEKINHDSSSSTSSCQYFVFHFKTYVADIVLHKMYAELCTMAFGIKMTANSTAAVTPIVSFHLKTFPYEFQIKNVLDDCRGSQLTTLTALKYVEEVDYQSHEDIGLEDVGIVVLTLLSYHQNESSSSSSIHHNLQTIPTISMLLHHLPKCCEASIICSQLASESFAEKYLYKHDSTEASSQHRNVYLLVGLRSNQLIENLSVAIQETNEQIQSLNVTTSPIDRKITKSRNQMSSNSNNTNKSPTKLATILPIKKYFLGKKCLEILFSEFSQQVIFNSYALEDLQKYIPRKFYSKAMDDTRSLDKMNLYMTVKSLFPPGRFTSTAVLFLEYGSNAVVTKHLSKILLRLEKENIDILDIKAIKNVQIFDLLYQENVSEYHSLLHTGQDDQNGKPKYASNDHWICILLRKQSALLKLKSIIGPNFDLNLAHSQYPKSLLSILNPELTDGRGSGEFKLSKHDAHLHLIPTLTCKTSSIAIEKCFDRYNGSIYDVMSINNLITKDEDDHDNSLTSTFPNPEVKLIDDGSKILPDEYTLAAPLHSLLQDRLNKAKTPNQSILISKSVLNTENNQSSNAVSSSKLNLFTKFQPDIAAIVVTNTLMKELGGLGIILDTLHREGLQVVNLYTTGLSTVVARQLSELAGVSSLTMKPSIATLTSGSAVVIGIEGPPHAFVKFKSFTVQPKSTKEIWRLNGGEWGVLASTSPRLGKDLFLFCFDKIFGFESTYQFTSP